MRICDLGKKTYFNYFLDKLMGKNSWYKIFVCNCAKILAFVVFSEYTNIIKK